jgi:hypothetical protein
MKNVMLLFVGSFFLAGCAHDYDMVLMNGMVITHVSKPKLDKAEGIYTYSNVTGEKEYIQASRVERIEPHSGKLKEEIPQQ